VAIDQLCSAGLAFAVPLAVWAADALPAVESESASPGFGHRGLLRRAGAAKHASVPVRRVRAVRFAVRRFSMNSSTPCGRHGLG
jgi:hypothetical protein